MKETWRAILRTDGGYKVSDHGRVRNRQGQILQPTDSWSKPYLRVRMQISKKQVNRKIHHLVLEAFRGPRPEGTETNHKDGNKSNNHISNLEWVTRSENSLHAYRTGLRSGFLGSSNGRSKIKDSNLAKIAQMRANGSSHREIGERFGVTKSTIQAILSGKKWPHKKAQIDVMIRRVEEAMK